MVADLNKLVARKKKSGEAIQTKADLLASTAKAGAKGAKGAKGKGAAGGEIESGEPMGGGTDITTQMTMGNMMSTGRKAMSESEKSIARSARVVEDTIAVANQTAAMLGEQTHQMEKIANDLDEITFNLKKAQKLLTDITRYACCVACAGMRDDT